MASTPSLDAFQHEVLEFFDNAGGRAIYADPVGARKTGTTLTWLSQQHDLPRTLIVAPKAVHGHWRREAGRFFPAAEVGMPGRTREDRHMGYGCIEGAVSPVIQLTTYEAMKLDEKEINATKFHTVVFDEGHRLKGRRTGVALCANAVTRDAECVLIVTGTPVVNHADELWQYLHMLDRKTYSSFNRWVRTHFLVEDTTFHGKLPRPIRVVHDLLPGHEVLLRKQLSKVMIQRQIHNLFPGEAWVEEPEHVVIDVDLDAAGRKAYDKLVKHGWAGVGNVDITTANKLALTTRLRQMASDWGTIDASLDDGPKVVAAAELIGDLARRETVVVFTSYKATAHRLVARLERLGLRARAWTGDESSADHEQLLKDYNLGEVDVVVGTLASLGEGVDGLQARGSSVVMLDRGWTPKDNAQAIGRRRRSGQKEKVSVYHLMYRNTIDVGVVEACMRKQNVIELLADRPLLDAIYGRGFDL